MFNRVLIPIVCLCLALTGCASQRPLSDAARQAAWDEHQREIAGLEVWRLAARMAVRLEDDAWSASLYWTQDRRDFNMRIVAPLGQGTVEIKGNPEAVQLRTMEDQVLTNQDVELLMRENLGWPLPVRSLSYWIKGVPEPGAAPETLILDDQGRITDLTQSNWRISYDGYTRVDGHDIPSRITLQRQGLRLRLSINHWDFST